MSNFWELRSFTNKIDRGYHEKLKDQEVKEFIEFLFNMLGIVNSYKFDINNESLILFKHILLLKMNLELHLN